MQTHICCTGICSLIKQGLLSQHIEKAWTYRWREKRTWLKHARVQRERKVYAMTRLSFLFFTGTYWYTVFSIIVSSCRSGNWNKRSLPCKMFTLLYKQSQRKTLFKKGVCGNILPCWEWLDKTTCVWIENIYPGLVLVPLRLVGVLLTWEERIRFSDGSLGVGQAEHSGTKVLW